MWSFQPKEHDVTGHVNTRTCQATEGDHAIDADHDR